MSEARLVERLRIAVIRFGSRFGIRDAFVAVEGDESVIRVVADRPLTWREEHEFFRKIGREVVHVPVEESTSVPTIEERLFAEHAGNRWIS